jgi:xanthine phosphoribosyltransferase
MTTHYLNVSWSDVHRDAWALAERLEARGPFKGIVAVARGGLVPAALVARALGCRMIETVAIHTYDEERPNEPHLMKSPSAAGDGTGWLLLDDLVDSGATARMARDLLPKAHFATLYAKPAGRPMVDDCVAEYPQDTWIIFPWETGPDLVRSGS